MERPAGCSKCSENFALWPFVALNIPFRREKLSEGYAPMAPYSAHAVVRSPEPWTNGFILLPKSSSASGFVVSRGEKLTLGKCGRLGHQGGSNVRSPALSVRDLNNNCGDLEVHALFLSLESLTNCPLLASRCEPIRRCLAVGTNER